MARWCHGVMVGVCCMIHPYKAWLCPNRHKQSHTGSDALWSSHSLPTVMFTGKQLFEEFWWLMQSTTVIPQRPTHELDVNYLSNGVLFPSYRLREQTYNVMLKSFWTSWIHPYVVTLFWNTCRCWFVNVGYNIYLSLLSLTVALNRASWSNSICLI